LNTSSIDVSKCPICESSSTEVFVKDGFPIRQCAYCKYLYVFPRPSLDVIINHYETAYRKATGNWYPKARSRRWRSFWRSLKLRRYISGKRVLDLGCGGGFMVEAFGRFAKESVGVDISKNSIAFASNAFPKHKFFAEDLGDFGKRGEVFDFVFSSEVLEHVLDPREFLETLKSCVKPGGFVYISAPDEGHEEVPSDRSSWSDVCPPEHLNWFNFHNMTWLFAEYGFVPYRRFKNKKPGHSVIFQKFSY
jgi:SAM-dependent methyltransferase